MIRNLIYTATILAIASTGNTALATEESQNDSKKNTPSLEEVLVTAQKRVQSINDVPITIDVVSGDEMKALGVIDADSLARVVPGFVVTNTYFGTPVYYLRGVGYLDTAIAARPAVAMYSNEVPLPFASTTLGATLDLERVEVLKGPQGTFFGSNATGGAINFIAARPTEEFSAGANLSYGRFNEINVDGFVSGALTDSLRGRIAIAQETMDEWQQSRTTNKENGAKDIKKARLSLDLDATEKLSFQFTASGAEDHSDSIAPQLVGKDNSVQPQHPLFVGFSLADVDDARDADWSTTYPDGKTLEKDDWTWQLSLRADYEVTPSMMLTSITAYTEAGIDRGYDADGTTANTTNLSVTGEIQSFFQELRISGETDSGLNYVVGANFQQDDSDELVTFFLPEGRNGLVFTAVFNDPSLVVDLVPEIAVQKTESWAVFSNIEYLLSDTLTVVAGIRYTDTETDFSGCALAGGNLVYANLISTILGATAPTTGECATFTLTDTGYVAGLAENDLSEDNIAWRLGLDWQPDDDKMVYASISRGYKAGSFSNISAVFSTQYEPVPEEQLTAYEIGAKIDITPALHLDAAMFYYDYQDKQQQGTAIVPVFRTLTALVTIPESHVEGAEIGFGYQATDGLLLKASGLYVDSEVDKSYMGTSVFGDIVDFKGSSFPNTPNWQLNGAANYNWSLTEDMDAYANVHFTYRSDTNSDFITDSRLNVGSYVLVDAQAGITLPDNHWRIELWGRNLTDEVYTSQIVRRQEALVRTVGMPRTFGVRVSYDY